MFEFMFGYLYFEVIDVYWFIFVFEKRFCIVNVVWIVFWEVRRLTGINVGFLSEVILFGERL